MSNIVINLAAEYTGNKAFKKAGKDVFNLEKSVKKLGKAIGISLSTAAVIAFGKASLKAFTEDEKAATMLANAVKNLGYEFSAPAVESFIQNLSKAAHVADDELRPAFQKLLTTTGSLKKSQELLTNAISISRGAGVDLATVASDLSNAYVGNTKGLKKYYLGLTQAQLKGMSFLEIQTKLNKQFSGANAKYLETYAGKIEAITVASGEAKETIGKGLVDALTLAGGGSTNVDNVTTAMESLATQTADTIRGVGVLASNLNSLDKSSGGVFSKLFSANWKYSWLNWLKITGQNAAPKNTGLYADNRYQQYAAIQAKKKEAEVAKKTADAQAKLNKQQIVNQKALTAEQKKQAALKKAGTVMDMEQIQIVAALKGKLSEDDRRRVELQAALLNGNEELATKLSKQILYATDSTGKLYQYFQNVPNAKNPFAYLDEWLVSFQKKMDNLKFPTGSEDIPHGNVAPTALSSIASGGTAVGFNSAGNIVVNVQGSVVSEDDLIAGILEGIQKRSLSGSPSSIGRIQGMFG